MLATPTLAQGLPTLEIEIKKAKGRFPRHFLTSPPHFNHICPLRLLLGVLILTLKNSQQSCLEFPKLDRFDLQGTLRSGFLDFDFPIV